MFKNIKKFFQGKTERERMEDFLNQAQSREHLEVLERQWFSQRNRKEF